jgi:hypothetical protein
LPLSISGGTSSKRKAALASPYVTASHST